MLKILQEPRKARLFRPGYFKPESVHAAADFLARTRGAKGICGGTDIMVERDPDITHLVDLAHLPLNYIKKRGDSVLIGSTTSIRQIELSQLFRKPSLRIVYDAVQDFGTIQVRNMASVGGNLCNGIPSADMPPPLIALDATVRITGPTSSRIATLQSMYRHVRKLALRRGELLTEIRIPKQPPHTAGAYLRLVRTQVDIALASAAVRLTLDKEGRVEDCRVVLGSVAPTPLRAKSAEAFFRKKKIDGETLAQAGRLASRDARPISDVRATADYRRSVVATLVERAAMVAVSRLVILN
jgi:carbon-monoxide dehydrogenase medium subunit